MVLGRPPSVKIYFATALVEMRNGIDGLRAMVEQVLKKDPNEGHLFVFIGKSKDKLKILFWDKNGYIRHADDAAHLVDEPVRSDHCGRCRLVLPAPAPP